MKLNTKFFERLPLPIIFSLGASLLTFLFSTIATGVEPQTLFQISSIVFGVCFLMMWGLLEFELKPVSDKIFELTQKRRRNKVKESTGERRKNLTWFSPWKGVYEEVTAFSILKEKEIEELRKSEVFRREFVANVSHELKTPLFAAQGFIHTLIDGAASDEKVRTRFLNKAAKSLDGLEILVQDLLMLSQIETGEIKMKIEPHDLVTLAHEVMEQFEETVSRKKIKLIIDRPKKPAVALADSKWIKQVFTNLVSNAIQHTSEPGTVVLKFDVSKKHVEVAIKDNGSGIAQEHIPRIFERFYRVDKSRSRDHGGTGLGLAIVKHILESHRTKAEVKSEVGKGSEFSFKLERVKPDEEG